MSDNAPDITIAKGKIVIETEGLGDAERRVEQLQRALDELRGGVNVKVEGERGVGGGGDGAGGREGDLTSALSNLTRSVDLLRSSVEVLESTMAAQQDGDDA